MEFKINHIKEKPVTKISIWDIPIGEKRNVFMYIWGDIDSKIYHRTTEKTIKHYYKETDNYWAKSNFRKGMHPKEIYFPTKKDALNFLYNKKISKLNHQIEKYEDLEKNIIPNLIKELEENND